MDTIIAVFFRHVSVWYVFYVSLQSFMSCIRSVKTFFFVSYFLFLINRQRSLAKLFPLPYLLPNLWSLYSLPDHALIAPQSNHASFYPMLQFTIQFLMLLSGWRFRPVFLSLDCLICAGELIPCLRGCKLECSFKDSLSC